MNAIKAATFVAWLCIGSVGLAQGSLYYEHDPANRPPSGAPPSSGPRRSPGEEATRGANARELDEYARRLRDHGHSSARGRIEMQEQAQANADMRARILESINGGEPRLIEPPPPQIAPQVEVGRRVEERINEGAPTQAQVEPLPTPDFAALGSGEFTQRSEQTWNRLSEAQAIDTLAIRAQSAGQAAVWAAVDAHREGDLEDAQANLKMAETLADVLVGLDPYTGFARDCYETMTGYNAITGQELELWERGLSVFGVAGSLVTFGAASSVSNALKATLRGVLRTGRGPMIARGVSAVVQAGNWIGGLKTVSAAQINRITEFSRRVFRNKIGNPVAVEHFMENWSQSTLRAYGDVSRRLALSPTDLAAEANRLGISQATLLKRRETAIAFYSHLPEFRGNALKVEDHLRGIDFRGPIEILSVPSGTRLYQLKAVGAPPGHYFLSIPDSPSRAGVGSLQSLSDGTVHARVLHEAEVTETAFGLRSRSSSVMDDWSLRERDVGNQPWAQAGDIGESGAVVPRGQYTSGGATQLVIDPLQVLVGR